LSGSLSASLPGLDPAIQLLRKMDHRVTRLRRGPVMTAERMAKDG